MTHVQRHQPLDIEAIVAAPNITPVASANGGFWFVKLDVLGKVYDLHALYKPEGRGAEAAASLKAALLLLDADVIVATETTDRQSRPPLSFGFRVAGDWSDSSIGPVRTWALTRSTWNASPARRRMH